MVRRPVPHTGNRPIPYEVWQGVLNVGFRPIAEPNVGKAELVGESLKARRKTPVTVRR